jgi:hypothetical protein
MRRQGYQKPNAIEGLFAISAALALPRFTAFLDQKPKDRERADAVDPPSSKDCLRTKAHDRDRRQPAARNRFHGVGPQRTAPQPIRQINLPRREIPHDWDCQQRDDEPWHRELPVVLRPKVPACRYNHIGCQSKQQRTSNSACNPLSIFRERVAMAKLNR